ncbi:MAG: Endonuclease/exonuclease/phosphatase, partial [Candidatus Yanofskybacteria bacterium GW2011_GWC2_37_9]
TGLDITFSGCTQPSITVLSPNGGEVWPVGSTQAIKWNSNGAPTIMVDLVRPNYECHLTNGDVPNTGSLTYTLSACINGLPIPQGSDVKIKVMYRSNAVIVTQDQSDSAFTITSESRKLSPCNNLGDVNADGFVTEDDAEVVRQIVSGLRPASTEETRRSDVNASGTVNTLDVTLIRRYVTGLDITFSGCTQPSITVLSPNGGEVWPVGSTQAYSKQLSCLFDCHAGLRRANSSLPTGE